MGLGPVNWAVRRPTAFGQLRRAAWPDDSQRHERAQCLAGAGHHGPAHGCQRVRGRLVAVGRELREEHSYALGATRAETLLRTILPAASSGILAAVILGLMRAIGETMVV